MTDPMNTDELRDLLDLLLWNQRDLAHKARRGQSDTHKMARGKLPIDQPLADWLRAIAAMVGSPPPRPIRIKHDDTTEPEKADHPGSP